LKSPYPHIKSDDLPIIHDILFDYYEPSLLYTIDRQEYLLRILKRTAEYLIDWFRYFLAEYHPKGVIYKPKLIEKWTRCFTDDNDLFQTIVSKMDTFCEWWSKNDDISMFLNPMVDQCFEFNRTFDLIEHGLNNIKNNEFIEQFDKKFVQNYVEDENETLKMLDNRDNPLVRLMNIDKKQNHENYLVTILIQSILLLIKITDAELISDTFRNPSKSTITYSILFDSSLNSFDIHKEIIVRLAKKFKEWKYIGLYASDIRIWKEFTREQHEIIRQIWTSVAESIGKQYELDQLFSLAIKDMKTKQEIAENVLTSIEIYCSQANDKDKYEISIRELREDLQRKPIQSVSIPVDFEIVRSFAEQLNPYVKTICWRTFLDCKRTNSNAFDEDLWPESEFLTDQSTFSSIEILGQTISIFFEFQSKIQDVCQQHYQLPINDILWIFSDINHAENDLHSLQSLINPEAFRHLILISSFWKNRIEIKHICQGLLNLSLRLNAFVDADLLTNVLNLNENTLGHQCIPILEQYQTQISENLSPKLQKFFSYYSSSIDLIRFLDQITLDDVNNLKESINDRDDLLIDAAVIFDLVLLTTFLDSFYAKIPKNYESIVQSIEELWQDNLLKCFESTSIALTCIQRIYLELTDKEQAKRRRISDVLNHSTINFTLTRDKFDVHVEYFEQQTLNALDLNELRDRVRLLEYSRPISSDEKIKLHYFIGLADVIQSMLQLLQDLHSIGYPNLVEYLSTNRTFSCVDGIFHDLSKTREFLQQQLRQWEQTLCSMYETHPNLTYFTGDHLQLIEDYIFDRSSFAHPGYHLLKYIDIEPQSIERPQHGLEYLGQVLTSSEPQTFNNKCLLIETTNHGVLRGILSLFSQTKIIPRVHHLFFCRSNTNWIEIRAFIYRCFFSRTFHLLIRPELLAQSIQDQSVRLLRQLIEKHSAHSFQMGLITCETPQHQRLISEIQSMNLLTILRDQPFDLTSTNQHCTLVTSKFTGLGKSTYIRERIRSLNRTYVKFPLTGDFQIESLAERFREKYDELQHGALHLDIGVISNHQQLNEILFCLIFFGKFRFGQETVCLPANLPIFIELDASPEAELNSLQLFEYFPSSLCISHVDWTRLDVERQDIQAVVKYLQSYDDGSIVRQNIDGTIMHRIDLNTCIDLIQKYFHSKFTSWTQLSIVIAVFHRLFTDFSRCPYFQVEYIPEPKLRVQLVETLLQSSNQFTSLAVQTVREQQRLRNKYSTSHIIQWSQTKPFTMIFTENIIPLFVYKSTNDIPSILVEYFKRYYSAATQNKQITTNDVFPDYDQLTHTDFFKKLTLLSNKYFNKSICLQCCRTFDRSVDRCSHCSTEYLLMRSMSDEHRDITKFHENIAAHFRKSYVLTPDNYIKMLLVYMRVLSRIPVLIMGETGKI